MKKKVSQNKILIGILAAVLATLIWSGNFIVARAVIHTIPPVTLAFYRWLTATVILFFFVYKSYLVDWPIVKNNLWLFLLSSVAGITLFNTFVYIAGHYSQAINMALIGTTSSPIMSVILARIFLKEKIPAIRIIGMAVCIVGILLLLSKGHLEKIASLSFSKGDWWMLAAAFMFAIYNVTVKKKPAAMRSRNFLFTVFLFGTILLFPFYLYELIAKGGVEINTTTISSFLYLGAGASVICYLLWNISIKNLGAGRASLFGNLIPVFSTIEAAKLLNEEITKIQVGSFLLVMVGLLIANLQRSRPTSVIAT